MVHFSCDLCGNALDDRRFVVRVEVFPVCDEADLEEVDELAGDGLQQIEDALESEADDPEPAEDEAARSYHYDLCPACHARFAKDPLGRKLLRRFNFSEN